MGDPSPLAAARTRLLSGEDTPLSVAENSLARANGNVGRNTYVSLKPDEVLARARALPSLYPDPARRPLLYGLPISLKDCFDLAGHRTSCGSRFYEQHNGVAAENSWVAQRLLEQGAVIVGKTHMHPLAYGITGENAEYGDCAQPLAPGLLTGGSSSGAAASIQERSALAAIGTDTGGSVRAPAALCHLAGYRASHGLGDWLGGHPLAPSFDTIGWLFDDLRDAPLLARALFGDELNSPECKQAAGPVRVAAAGEDFVADCDSESQAAFTRDLDLLAGSGAVVERILPVFLENDAFDIYAALQAMEAWRVHRGNFEEGVWAAWFPEDLRERLLWGASISAERERELRAAHLQYRADLADFFTQYSLLALPVSPMVRLALGANHSRTRRAILRFTVPASMGGLPVVTLPGGTQLASAHGTDAALVAFAAQAVC